MTSENENDDAALLDQYVADGSPEAFAALVTRHAGWVHGVARRRLRDAHAAQDVTQAVFLLLAGRAGTIRDGQRLGAWLVRATHFAANHAARAESRRRRHEREAARSRRETSPAGAGGGDALAAVDQAVAALRAPDQQAIVLRYYRGLSLADVGTAMGVSEEAARKRVTRALGRLRGALRGTESDVAALSAALASVSGGAGPSALDCGHLAGRALDPQAAGPEARRISEGAKRMMRRSIVRSAAATAAAIALCGGVVAMAVCRTDLGSARAAVATTSAATKPAAAVQTWVSGGGVTLAVSPDGRSVAGHSKLTGRWTTLGERVTLDRPRRLIVGEGVGVVFAPEGLFAYSPRVGTWARLPLAAGPTPDGDNVKVSHDLAYVVVGEAAYAYSARTGTWDAARVPAGIAPDVTFADPDLLLLQGGPVFAAFAAESGRWASPDFSGGAAAGR